LTGFHWYKGLNVYVQHDVWVQFLYFSATVTLNDTARSRKTVFSVSFINRFIEIRVLYTIVDQKLMNSLHRLSNCEIGGLDYRVITTEYRTRAHCIQTLTRHS